MVCRSRLSSVNRKSSARLRVGMQIEARRVRGDAASIRFQEKQTIQVGTMGRFEEAIELSRVPGTLRRVSGRLVPHWRD